MTESLKLEPLDMSEVYCLRCDNYPLTTSPDFINQSWAPGWQPDGPDELSLHESVFCRRPFSAAAPGDSPPSFSPPTPAPEGHRYC